MLWTSSISLLEKWNRFLEYRFPLRPLTQVFEPSIDGSTTSADAALAEKIKQAAEKEGFRVNIDRGDTQQGQQFKSSSSNGKKGAGPHIVDPQTVAMPNTGQPGQISVAALFKRVAADQLLMAPIGLAIFISTMAILEGLDWDQVVERYKRLYWPVLLINWQMFVGRARSAPSLVHNSRFFTDASPTLPDLSGPSFDAALADGRSSRS